MDVQKVTDLFQLILLAGVPLALGLWAIWRRKGTLEQKIKDSIPIVWNVVQQELRKNGGTLSNDKTPLDRGIGLLKTMVKLTPKQEAMAELALKAYHEAQGAPNPTAKPKHH